MNLVLDVCLLSLVEVDLDEPRAIQLDADSLADNFRREAEVFQDRIVHCRQRPTIKINH